ncbi:VOC family protein [Halobacterium litoreum]|uniref:VOC family protein n=1 Tax=Halobacterium litoreum TaxID=2039234 RepID=A0ABD5NB97_9EURY|nr:VOC family protein [Halobacterium litoreum]UHH14741.1 VOC family protein [Halobacterium litoreum]
MLDALDSLALEVHHLDDASDFYETHLGLDGTRTDHEARYEVGDTTLVLREPSTVPRGGVHVHYAFATTEDRYDEWYDALDDDFDLAEFDFGSARSLYFDDPDAHCVEIGTAGPEGDDALTGIFEVVLEVEDLASAEAFYRDLGFEVVDRGDGRDRVRLAGPVDLELWEPQRGIADARGGVHVDLGFLADDPSAAAAAVADRACEVADIEAGVRVRDPDGHYLTFHEA